MGWSPCELGVRGRSQESEQVRLPDRQRCLQFCIYCRRLPSQREWRSTDPPSLYPPLLGDAVDCTDRWNILFSRDCGRRFLVPGNISETGVRPCVSVCLCHIPDKKLRYRRGTARRVTLANSCHVSRGMGVRKASNSISDLQGQSIALAMMPFDRPYTIC